MFDCTLKEFVEVHCQNSIDKANLHLKEHNANMFLNMWDEMCDDTEAGMADPSLEIHEDHAIWTGNLCGGPNYLSDITVKIPRDNWQLFYLIFLD